MGNILSVCLGVALLLTLFASSPARAQNGDIIVATATFQADGIAPVSSSVSVTLLVRAQSTVEFLKYAPSSGGTPVPGAALLQVAQSYYRTGSDPSSPFAPMALPVPFGATAPIDLGAPIPLVAGNTFHAGETIFIRVTDPEQNLDGGSRESAIVTLRNEATGILQVVRLTETAPDSGVFVGFINTEAAGSAGSSYSGILPVAQSTPVSANYVNALDGANNSRANIIVDPFGIVFDSRSGLPVDGAVVTLWDMDADDYATVYGDDGSITNIFPAPAAGAPRATVTTGSTPSDSSGRVYAFPPGGFRFPFVKPGHYQLRITPPPGYLFPSSTPDGAIAALPGGPFTIVDGSRGLPFSVDPGPALRIDVPVDPVYGVLWTQKSASKQQAAPGDFVQYQVTVQNTQTRDSLTAKGVKISDRLPEGFRYQKGSARLNGAAASDPAVSADGRTLLFAAGDLPAKAAARLTYVVQLSAGAKPGTAVNSATAFSGTVSSNVATAEVEVRSDFLSSRSLIMGRVYNGVCSDAPAGDEGTGIAGVRIYLEDGTFVETDKNGMYHFEGVTPASHVVQLDLDSLPPGHVVAPCEENSRFAGRGYSQFVDLQGGSMWRADFHLARAKTLAEPGEHDENVYLQRHPEALARTVVETPQAPEEPPEEPPAFTKVGINLTSVLNEDSVEYRVRTFGGPEPLKNRVIRVTLPPGVSYIPGSSLLDGKQTADPNQEGPVLRYPLGSSGQAWSSLLSLRAVLTKGGTGEDEGRAVLEFDTEGAPNLATPEVGTLLNVVREERVVPMEDIVLHPRFPSFSAELSAPDKKTLDELAASLASVQIKKITVEGHTDNVKISARGRRIMKDNVVLSQARAQSVGRYLMQKLQLTPDRIDYAGYGEARPVASNKTPEGRAENRRVEIRVQAVRYFAKDRLELLTEESGEQEVEIPITPPPRAPAPPTPAPVVKVLPPVVAPVVLPPEEDPERIKEPQGILSPAEGNILVYPINGVRICLDSGLTPRLTVDGKIVGADRIGFSMKDPKSGKSIYSYIGVDFGTRGERVVLLEGLDPFGVSRFKQSVKVTRSGEIAEIRLKSSAGNIADGKTPVRLKLELLDSAGNTLPAAADLEIRDGNLKPLKEAQAVPDLKADQAALVHVDQEGNALFQPVGTSGAYRVVLGINGVKLEAETYVKPVMREWILVGIAEGTAGYNTISGHMEGAKGGTEGLYDKERLAFYTKGTIKGEWLITASYDSAKGRGGTGNGLFQQIDPNRYYTLYGDATLQQYDAASMRKLYVKVEREQFYAMLGDFDTGLTVTELARYSRRINGVKSEYHDDNVEVTAFGSQTGQAYVKDEIPGDGTSGLYHLSRKPIAMNSEKVRIEVRDRFRSEIVISSRELTRFTEYNIDYDSGTLLFKEPIYNRDDKLNPIIIVSEYETRDAGGDAVTYGGRAGVKLRDRQIRAGVSYVHEGQVSGSANMVGVDGTMQFGKGTTLKIEAAHSERSYPAAGSGAGAGATGGGSAYLAELTDKRDKLDSRLYYREVGTGYGLGQQQTSEVGTRKVGAEAAYKLSDPVTLSGAASRQYMLSTGAVADRLEGKETYTSGNYAASVGVRYASDRLADGSAKTSQQLTLGGSVLALDKKLTLSASRDQSIGGNSNADYPTRTLLGAEYKVKESLSVFGQQEFTEGESTKGNTTRIGMKSTPWEGGALDSSVERKVAENQERTFAVMGLKQTWKLSEQWSVDGGLGRNQTLKSSYRLNPAAPPASGGEDFTSVSLGTEYKEKLWSWTCRGEYRTSPTEDKWGFMTGAAGEPKKGWGLLARFQLFDTEGATQQTLNTDLRLGLVYRPLQTRWIILDRIDFLYDRQDSGASSSESRRVVNNLNANFKPDRKTQLSLQYGAKYVLETIDADEYSGYTDLMGIEGRYDVTAKWDVGVRGSVLHTWTNGEMLGSYGVSVGYNIVENAWLSLGYNLTGFTDKDFSASNYTAMGPYLAFRFKFDQNSIKDAIRGMNP